MMLQAVKAAPVLKWVGGKGRLLAQLAPLFPPTFARYYEPFVGGGAVFLHLAPPVAILNDGNPHIAALYRHLRDETDPLLQTLHDLRRAYLALSHAEREYEYYRLRARYNVLPPGAIEKSALLVVLNKTGYNGLYRENRRGGLNVPFGRYDNPTLFDEANMRAVAARLHTAEITSADFADAVANAQAGDFVYFDPPYMPVSKTAAFTAYNRTGFAQSEHIRLADVFRLLARRGVQVMLSNSDSSLVRDLYKDFRLHAVWAARAVNSNPARRGKVAELVVTSY